MHLASNTRSTVASMQAWARRIVDRVNRDVEASVRMASEIAPERGARTDDVPSTPATPLPLLYSRADFRATQVRISANVLALCAEVEREAQRAGAVSASRDVTHGWGAAGGMVREALDDPARRRALRQRVIDALHATRARDETDAATEAPKAIPALAPADEGDGSRLTSRHLHAWMHATGYVSRAAATAALGAPRGRTSLGEVIRRKRAMSDAGLAVLQAAIDALGPGERAAYDAALEDPDAC